jgi:dTDP-4-dehydrorhamnose reductase
MSWLLTGAAGQLGFELHRALAPLAELVPATRDGRLPGDAPCEAVDLSAPDSLAPALDRLQPRVVLNAAAYTAVDRAESEPDLAQRVNADAVDAIARWCGANDALLLQWSTDYVFDGAGERAWLPDDPVAPLGVYGRSKLGGEQAIRAAGCRHLIFRTAWVYAARGHNFLRTMLRLGAERDALRVVADQFGAPTPARWIAATTAAVLAKLGEGASAGDARLGTHHLVASGHTSWHGFAEAIFAEAVQAGLLDRAPQVEAIATADYPTPAQRPAWSVLDSGSLQDAFGLRLPDWRAGVSEVVAELAAR